MPDLIPKRVVDYLTKLRETFWKQMPFDDFWVYVQSRLLEDDSLMLGDASYQVSRINTLANDWLKGVSLGEIPVSDKTMQALGGTIPPTEEETVAAEEQTGGFGLYTDQQITDMAKATGKTEDEIKTIIANNELGINIEDTSELTAWQKAQLAQSNLDRQAQFDLERQRFNQETTTNWQRATLDRINEAGIDREKLKTEENARLYQQVIDDLRSELNPTDFAQKYILDIKEKENPYIVQPRNEEEMLAKYEGDKNYLKSELKYLNQQLNDLSSPLLQNEQTMMIKNTLESAINQLDINIAAVKSGTGTPIPYTYVEKIADLFKSGQIGGFSGGQSLAGDLTYGAGGAAFQLIRKYQANPNDPELANLGQENINLLNAAVSELYTPKEIKQPSLEIPSWLRGSIAGSPTSIQGTKWGEAITPSAQTINTWNPTQSNIWSSYVKASGGNTGDLLTQMSNMLPKEYKTASWRTASQI